MVETPLEVTIGAVARAGIITAHLFEFVGGYHTVAAVALLWSVEEIIAIGVSARHLRGVRRSRKNQ